MRTFILSTLFTLAAATAQAADPSFTVSAAGPGVGKGAGKLGAGVAVIGDAVLPSFSAGYTYGISDALDFHLSADLAFIASDGFGALGTIDPGILLRITDRSTRGGLAFKIAPEVLFVAGAGKGSAVGGAAFGLTPGLVGSFGSEDVQLSLGIDLPSYFAAVVGADGDAEGGGFLAFTVRPYLAVETPFGAASAFFVRASTQLLVSGEPELLTFIGTAGFSF